MNDTSSPESHVDVESLQVSSKVCLNVGFRTVEIRQGRLLLNGRCLAKNHHISNYLIYAVNTGDGLTEVNLLFEGSTATSTIHRKAMLLIENPW